MNAVEIDQAITDLAEQPFDPAQFPYAFLEAFGNKATTIKRLRAGASNKSDRGGVLQTSNIHILTCDAGRVMQTLAALKASPATAKAKSKFILATDGADFEAEGLTSGETVACAFKDFPDHCRFVNQPVLDQRNAYRDRFLSATLFRHVVIDGFLAAQLSGTGYKRP